MKKISRRSFLQATGLMAASAVLGSSLTACGDSNASSDSNFSNEHEPITMISSFHGAGEFAALVRKKYPEINLETIPYSGANMTAYMRQQLSSGEMPDIYSTTVYFPGWEDVSDKLIDLAGYDFTSSYSEARLRDVSDNGALYLLPTAYNCIGITYNKKLLEDHGWTRPTTFAELEELAPKAKEAGVTLAIDQIKLPGAGFQYFCNILDTVFLNTLDGRKWQRDFLSGNATVKDTPALMESLSTLEKWKKLGMLSGDSSMGASDVQHQMQDGNTLFMLGASNLLIFQGENASDFGLMPYLSQDGTQNALILNVSRYVGLSKHLEEPGSEQKLEDALHVMEVLSSEEGMAALNKGGENSSMLPLQDYEIPEDNIYKQNEDDLNAGMTAPYIYAGWDNLMVPAGEAMIAYIEGKAELDDVVKAFDDNQSLVTGNTAPTITTVTDSLDNDACAKLVGAVFGQASGADLALISKNKWYESIGDFDYLNTHGVSGSLPAMPVQEQNLTVFLPTGWRGTIQTVTLTGARVKELAESGLDLDGVMYPYELVTPEGMTIEDGTTYTVAICGATDEVAAEGNMTDTGISGLEAMTEYLSQFEAFSKDDIRWE